jgi:drug/metabolite transporter (DMT)-like permease
VFELNLPLRQALFKAPMLPKLKQFPFLGFLVKELLMSKKPTSWVIALAPPTFVVLWATGFVVAKLSAGHVAPVWFLSIRFPIAGLFMLAMAILQKTKWPDAKHATHAAVAGAFLHGGYLAPIYWAVANGLPAGVSALIVGLQPLLTTFIAAAMLDEKTNVRHWLGLLVGIIGIGLVLAPKLSFALLGGITPFTSFLAVAGAISISFGTVYQKKFATEVPLATGGVWQYVGASLVTVLASFFLNDFIFDHSWQAWGALAWAVIVLSIISILLLMVLIRDGEVSRVSSVIYLVPAVASLMTYCLFNETLSVIQILGMALCAAAVLVVMKTKPNAASTLAIPPE